MKTIYSILLFICFDAKATYYYVSNSGNDFNNGTSKATAWKTIKKVNTSVFLPGDHILFKAGNVWNEKLIVPSSGSPGNIIIFGRFGTGAKPIITGLQAQGDFSNMGNIWTTTAKHSVPNLNTVVVNGSIRAKGRYPNTGYLTFTSYNEKNQITGSLPGAPSYTGAELVVRSAHWIIDVSKITSQAAGTLNFSPPLTYAPKLGGNGYFIQNSPSVLDTQNEWAYDSTTKILKVYSTKSPTVQISAIDTLVFINKKEYITFDGLTFQGANTATFQLFTTKNIIIRNCSCNYSGGCAIFDSQSSHLSIVNDSIQNSLCNAVYLNSSDAALVVNNYIKNSGTMAGMGIGLGLYTKYYGIFVLGAQPTITNNRIDSTGYISLMFSGRNSVIKNNYISNFCFVKDDGGGIYTVIGNKPPNIDSGSIIRSNIVINGIGALAGTLPSSASPAAGIYLDEGSKQITVDSNTVSNCYTSGISFHNINSIICRENTVYNNTGVCLAIYGSNELIFGLDIKRNIMISTNPKQPNFLRTYGTSVSTIDSNYYYKPSPENIDLSGTLYKLSDWSAKTGQDSHSISIPEKMSSSTPLFYYNPGKSDKTISLNGTYIDTKGRLYKNSITLHSFCSAILFKKE
jgi:parallel beta-helix repeat protein